MALETLTAFFGWLTILNIGVLTLTTVIVLGFRDGIAGLHAGMFGLDSDWVKKSYYSYLAAYKILALTTSLLPYIALKLI